MRTRNLTALISAMALGGLLIVPAGSAVATPATGSASIDFSQSSGSYIHQNQYNNSNGRPSPGLADYAQMNANGMKLMHAYVGMGDIFPTNNVFDPENNEKKFAVAAVAKNSETFMLNLNGYGTAANDTDYANNLLTAITYYKQKYANLEYVEFWNESDSGSGWITTARALELYKALAQSVIHVNDTVTNGKKLKVGGLADGGNHEARIPKLVDYCVANNLPLDFASWHRYEYTTNRDYSSTRQYLDSKGFNNTELWMTEYNWGYTTSPDTPTNTFAALAGANAASSMKNLTDQNIHGIQYKYKSPWNEAQGQVLYTYKSSSGMSSAPEKFDFTDQPARYVQLQVNANSSYTVPKVSDIEVYDTNNNKLSATVASTSTDTANAPKILDGDLSTYWSGGKDQEVVLDLGSVKNISFVKIAFSDGATHKVEFRVRAAQDFSGYNNVLGDSEVLPAGYVYKMWNMLEDTRVPVNVTAGVETEGKGIGAFATKSDNRVAMLVWNYQNTGTSSYDTNLALANLPSGFTGKAVHVKQYLVDETHSNYTFNGATNLEQVADSTQPAGLSNLSVSLAPNAVSLIELTPEPSTPESSKNFLTNGNFESGDISPWISKKTAGIDSTGYEFEGASAGYVTPSSRLTQRISGLSPNTTYTLSANARVESPGDAARITIEGFGGAKASKTVSDDTYQPVSIPFTTGPSRTYADVVFDKSASTGPGRAFIDNVRVDAQ